MVLIRLPKKHMYNDRYKGRKMYKMRGDSIYVTIPALGHSYGSWTVTKAATCTTDGSQKRTCSRCKMLNPNDKGNRTYIQWFLYVTKEATCTTAGTR